MVDVVAELMPETPPVISSQDAFKEICSVKRLGITAPEELRRVLPGAIVFLSSDLAYYAEVLSKMPPGTTAPSIESESVRLNKWSVLCKIGAVELSFQLGHEGVALSPEFLETVMLDNVVENSNKLIIAHLAAHSRAINQVRSAQH